MQVKVSSCPEVGLPEVLITGVLKFAVGKGGGGEGGLRAVGKPDHSKAKETHAARQWWHTSFISALAKER